MRKRTKLKKITPSWIIVAALTLYLLALIVNQQIDAWKLEKELKSVQREIQAEAVRREQLRKQVEQLNSLDYIEKSAREELGLLREGETPYMTITPEQTNDGAPSPPR